MKICPTCDKRFRKIQRLRIHHIIQHEEDILSHGYYGTSFKVICDQCGAQMKRSVSEIKNTQTEYCSNKCYLEAVKGNNSYEGDYGENCMETRNRIVRRDEHKCQRCGVEHDERYDKVDLEVHHLKPVEEFDTPEEANKRSNLVTLCETCHRIIHHIQGGDNPELVIQAVKDQLGSKAWPQTFTADSQKFIETENAIGFILKDGVFRKAGKYCWEQEFQDDILSLPGISLNDTLYNLIEAKDEKEFYVYDRSSDRYFRLEDRNQMREHVGYWKQGGKKLKVTPLDCYRTTEQGEVPESIQEYVSRKNSSTGSSRLY